MQGVLKCGRDGVVINEVSLFPWTVTLWDKDTFTKDDMIGSLFIDLEECTYGPSHARLLVRLFQACSWSHESLVEPFSPEN